MSGSVPEGATKSRYSESERRLLERYVSVVEPREHADVFLIQNLPPEVAATLNGVYSRSSKSLRDNLLDRLKKGLESVGRDFEELVADLPEQESEPLEQVISDKAGQFLKTYAIDHGHNSLREGSVVHLAVENVSQLVTRYIQRERRCSFEESSTRYISFEREGHWRDPDVVAHGGEVLEAYDKAIEESFALYQELSRELLEHLKRERPLSEGERENAWIRALRAEAFDAARYLLTPAINTKWGLVIDARTLSDVIRELRSHPLKEFQQVGDRLSEEASSVLPTLLAHGVRNEFLAAQHVDVRAVSQSVLAQTDPTERQPETRLLDYDKSLDQKLLASMLYEHSDRSFSELQAEVERLDEKGQLELFEKLLGGRGKHDDLPIGLEGAQPFCFETLVDFGAYRDIGRHRKGLQQQQLLTTRHGFVVPPLVDQAGFGDRFRAVMRRCAEHQQAVADKFPHAAGYVTPFGFLQRIRLIFDPRQVGYFVELRSKPDGHFAYREVAQDMYRLLREVAPLYAQFIQAFLGDAFVGRMVSEQTADDKRRERMRRAGDL
ncbi:MAG: FAD-dependent thymidylate synthase [Planctomycetota bacterium]